jgi:hypothetical protein
VQLLLLLQLVRVLVMVVQGQAEAAGEREEGTRGQAKGAGGQGEVEGAGEMVQAAREQAEYAAADTRPRVRQPPTPLARRPRILCRSLCCVARTFGWQAGPAQVRPRCCASSDGRRSARSSTGRRGRTRATH